MPTAKPNSRTRAVGLLTLAGLTALMLGCDHAAFSTELDSETAFTVGSFKPHGARDPHAALGPDALLQVALQHLDAGRPVEAKAALSQAIDKYPETAKLYAARGALLLQEQRYAVALDDFNAAINLDPSDPITLTNRAQAYRAFDRNSESLADLDRALTLAPDLVAARFNRGVLRYQRGRYAEALGDFDRAIAVDPHAPAPYFNRAVTHDALGRREEAEADLQRFIRIADNADWKQTAADLLKAWQTETAASEKMKPQG